MARIRSHPVPFQQMFAGSVAYSGGVKGFVGLLRRITRLGVHPAMDAGIAKRILIANQLALSYLVLAIPYVVLFHLVGTSDLAGLLVLVMCLHGVTLRLNAKGHPLAARLYLALLTSITITAFSFALGRGSFLHILLLPATMNYIILFDWEKERVYAALGIAANTAMLVGYHSLSYHAGVWYTFPQEIEKWVRIAMTLAAEILLLFGFLHLLMGNRRTEKALAAARESALAGEKVKSRFIATLSHEIRTPLNVIMGMVNLLDKPQSEDRRKDLLGNIRASAADLLAILNDVLDLSRIEAGKLQVESLPFNLPELADFVLQPYLDQAKQTGVGIFLELEAGLPTNVLGDPLRIRQVLNNLLANAFKFTKTGKIVVRISRDAGFDHRLQIAFEVEDTGVGIPDETQARLFQSFGQADVSTTRLFGGSGLGLAICKHLTELMGGAISLRSRSGEGTVVRFTAASGFVQETDLSESEDPDIGHIGTGRELQAVSAPERKTGGEVKILIVEDHSLNRVILKGLLETLGFQAEEAFDGSGALTAFSARYFDIILMDCHMQEMDGLESTRRIRKLGGRQPLIVGVTADAMVGTRAKCLQAGMNDVILKPLNLQDLEKILAPWKAKQDSEPKCESNPATSADWVNVSQINKLVETTKLRDPVYRSQAIRQFESEVRNLSSLLHHAYQSGDPGELRTSAHGLKGLCLTMGLTRLAEACKRLENSATNVKTPDWSPALADWDAALDPSFLELQRIALPAIPKNQSA